MSHGVGLVLRTTLLEFLDMGLLFLSPSSLLERDLGRLSLSHIPHAIHRPIICTLATTKPK